MIRKISIFLVAALLLVDYLSPVASAAVALQDVYAQIETTPVAAAGDAADDPAIWVHPTDPSLSLVFGNNKGGKLKEGSLESYDLSGRLLQKISTPSGFYGNVDVRGNYVVVAKGGIRVYQINPDTRKLSLATDGSGTITTAGEGLCLYDPGVAGVTDGLYAFTITRSIGRVRQYQLLDADRDGLLTGSLVRDFTIGTEAEGCVADDVTGNLFISEEDVALWRYGADASSGTTRTLIDAVDEDTPGDLEGVAIAGNHLFVSVQNVAKPNQNFVNVYEKAAPYNYVKSVRVSVGTLTDDCDRTDGIAAYSGYLNETFTQGLFVCQDGNNSLPGGSGNQNFKLVRLEDIISQ